ncbi:MAG: 4-(cytidine 5'-diphospho)-2-C-methyl-D-erythritol kinase [Azospirillum sp.]|nr:4-(cytidine 5'-diphospho)-2-C-methyl-D-erythritol kinase [Azospirillum sp.]
MTQAIDDTGAVHEAAPAKVNLYLHVLGRRANGYHELDSLVMFAEAGDHLTIAPAAQLSLRLRGRFAPALAAEPPDGNLVMRAAQALALALGRAPTLAITLTKALPVASGIGGGSADAAACLRGLARLWSLPPDHPTLAAVAAGLGADLPVCLAGRPAFFGGIGEVLDPTPPLPDCPAVLVNPGLPLPTPAVFKARQGGFSQPARFDAAPAGPHALAELLAQRHNDLTAPAIHLAPLIAEVLEALSATSGCLLARLSGSGATCFGLYPDAAAAATAAAAIAAGQPAWWVAATRLCGTARS